MASNFFNQLPGFNKLPFGWGKEEEPNSPPSGGYRARKSISESHRPRLESQMSMSLINKGLLNPTGENNCFLNSAVQILWHIDVFRRSFRKVKGHMCVEKACIFCALKDLFNEFQHGKQSVIPPDTLRRAMADCYEEQHRFQLGLMDDAAECFEKILEQLHLHLTGSEDMDTCSAAHCLSHQKFSLTILERTECVCGATSEPLSFVQFVHYISSSAIAKEAQKYAGQKDESHTPSAAAESKDQGSESNSEAQGTSSGAVDIPDGSAASKPRLNSASHVHFGRILNQASSFGEYRHCPDYERCRKTVAVKRILLNCPDVVCLGMIWDSDRPSVEDIMSVVLSIGLNLQLNDLFDHVFSDGAQFNQFELTALIAYYGRHYSTFCYHSKMREWVYFDDAKFRTVGTEWGDVCEVIRKAHYQPLLLVYTNPFAETMDMSQAPTVVTKMKPPPQASPSLPLSTISEEAVSKATPAVGKTQEPTLKPTLKEAGPGPVSRAPGGDSRALGSSPALTHKGLGRSQTHSIDPMTLSLRGPVTGTKATSPVIESNPASATPTSEGTTPTSARQLALMSDEQPAPDLMSFSISPGLLGGVAQGGVTRPIVGMSQPYSNGTQLELSAPPLRNGDVTSNDLIEFSLSPAVLKAIHSNPGAKGQPMTYSSNAVQRPHSNTPVLHGTHSLVQPGAHSHFISQPVPPSHSPVPRGTHSPVLPLSHSPSPVHPGSHSDISRRSPVQSQSSQQVKGNVQNGSKITAAATESQLRPLWEHFSDESLKPVVVAPQKLIQPTPGGGVANSGSQGSIESSRPKPGDDHGIEKAWTMVSKLSDSGESADSGSKAVRQLQRVASQNEGDVVRASDPSVGEFMLESVTLNGEVGVANSRRKFSPLPPTPDEGASVGRSLAGVSKVVTSPPPPQQPTNQIILLDDLEYAFPSADQMFAKSGEVKSAKVKSAKVKSSDRNFDYAELDFGSDPASKGGVASASTKASKVDYVLLNTNSDRPRYEFQQAPAGEEKEGDYSRLVDVRVERDPSMPIGNDPLYSVPDKTQRNNAASNTGSGGSRDPDYAVLVKSRPHAFAGGVGVPRSAVGVAGTSGSGVGVVQSGGSAARSSGGGGVRVPQTGQDKVRKETHKAVTGLDLATRKKLQDAQDLFAKAEASAGNDDTVAMVLYQQFNDLLWKVLQDPVVIAMPTLCQQIKTKRADGIERCLALQKGQPSKQTTDMRGQCKGCGNQRNLDDQQLCGPCQLREKMKRS